MNKTQISLFVFGLYMVLVVGLGFMFVPMIVLNLFGLSAGDDVWIRFVGSPGVACTSSVPREKFLVLVCPFPRLTMVDSA